MYFDDFEVMLTEGKVVQSNNYYPFGLQQNTSWTRAEQTPNAHKFNAATEYNDFTDTYDTPFRQYDPATGRFNGVDALAHMTPTLTPYRFGFNNPVSFNDPTGLTERPVELDDPNLRAPGGQASILSGADNDFSMIWFSGSMGPGSGRHWADGIHYSDWTLHGGSDTYRRGRAAGAIDIGGVLHTFARNDEGKWERRKLEEDDNGELGYYTNESYHTYSVVGGRLVKNQYAGVRSRFVSFEDQDGGDYNYHVKYQFARDFSLRKKGIEIFIGANYTGDKKYKGYNWFQTVKTNKPLDHPSSPYIDSKPASHPFYYDKYDVNYWSSAGDDLIFNDKPRRNYSDGFTNWVAELSFMGQNADGSWERIFTVSYGFFIISGEVYSNPLVPINSPSKYHINNLPK